MRNIPALLAMPAALVAIAPSYGAEYLTVPQAQTAMFPEADRFVESHLKLDKAQREQIEALSGVRQRKDHQPVWRAEQNGQLLGWFIVDEVVGKHEFITYSVGLRPDGHVRGVDVLVYRETYGGEVRDAAWREHFENKTLTDAFTLDQDVPNITGATLSCRNLANGVKRLLALQKVALKTS